VKNNTPKHVEEKRLFENLFEVAIDMIALEEYMAK